MMNKILRLFLYSVITIFYLKNTRSELNTMLLLPIYLLLMFSPGFGQERSNSGMGTRFITDVGDAFNGSLYVFTKPLHWRGEDWLNFGYVIAGAVSISLLDQEVRGFFQRNQSKTGDVLAKIGKYYGEPLSVVLITGSIYLFGNMADNSWARETAIIMTAALLPGGIYQTVTKISAGRARPYLESGNYYFDSFRRGEDYHSFVSGHTLVAMTTSLVLAGRINNTIAKGFLYALGFVAGISRLYSDDHWLSDVSLGGALAAAVTHTAKSWSKTSNNNSKIGLDFYVFPSRNRLTLTLKW
jgi:membrane-associated phospholipid phosphatase